ncbi:MAG: PcfJ domain-containing protein [Rickettsiales bacterium]|nr:PcfJ domain-containing protein [Rickettsiales bacterium]
MVGKKPDIPDCSVFTHIEGLEDIRGKSGKGKGPITLQTISGQHGFTILAGDDEYDGKSSPFFGMLAETKLLHQHPEYKNTAMLFQYSRSEGNKRGEPTQRKLADRTDDLNFVIDTLKPYPPFLMTLGMSRGWLTSSNKPSKFAPRFIDHLASLHDTSLLASFLSGFDKHPKMFMPLVRQKTYPRRDRLLLQACAYDPTHFTRLEEVIGLLEQHVPNAMPTLLENSSGLIEMVNAQGHEPLEKARQDHVSSATKHLLDSLSAEELSGLLSSQFLADGRKGEWGKALVFEWISQVDPDYLTQLLNKISPQAAQHIFEKYAQTITSNNQTAKDVLDRIDSALNHLFGDNEDIKAKMLGCVSMDASFMQGNCDVLKPLGRYDMLCKLKEEDFNQLSPALQKAVVIYGREHIFGGCFRGQSRVENELQDLLGDDLLNDWNKALPPENDFNGWFAFYHVMRREMLMMEWCFDHDVDEMGLTNTIHSEPFIDRFRSLLENSEGDWKTMAFRKHEGRKTTQPLDLQSIDPYFARMSVHLVDDVTRYVVLPYLAKFLTLDEKKNELDYEMVARIIEDTRLKVFDALFVDRAMPLNRLLVLSKAWQEQNYNLREFPSEKVWQSPFIDALGKPIHSIDLTPENISTPAGDDTENIFIQPLTSTQMLEEEGRVLNHCVGQSDMRFIHECQEGMGHIVSIRKHLPDGRTQHLSTLNFSIVDGADGSRQLQFGGNEGQRTESGRTIIQEDNMNRIENQVWLWLKEQVERGDLQLTPEKDLGAIERLAPSLLDEEYGFYNDYSTPENARRSELNRQMRFDIISGHCGHTIQPADISHLLDEHGEAPPEHHGPLRAEPIRAPAFGVHMSNQGKVWKLCTRHYEGKHVDKFILDHNLLEPALDIVPEDKNRNDDIYGALKERAEQRSQLEIRPSKSRRPANAQDIVARGQGTSRDGTGQDQGGARG